MSMKAQLLWDAIIVAECEFSDEFLHTHGGALTPGGSTYVRLEPTEDAIRSGLFNRHTTLQVVLRP